MAVEKAPVWTFPTNPKRLGRWYGKGPADRSPVGPGPAAARRASSAMIPVRRFRGPQNMETDGIMRKEDGPIRHKEIFKESDGPVRKGKGWPAGSALIGSGLPPRSGFHGAREGVPAACPRRESNPAPSQRRKQRRYRWGPWARPGRKGIWARPWARAADRGGGPPRARGQVRRITPPSSRCRPGPSPRVGGTRSAGPRRRPRRAQPARPRRCSRRSRRAARGRHHPTTGRTGWHRR